MKLPLDKIKVLDFTRLIPGPWGARLLADMGAEVTKVEDSKRPDTINDYPPYEFDGESSLSILVNLHKKRLCLDFSHKKAKAILKEIIKNSDVLLESFRPGVMKRYGLDAKTLHRINPKLIYVSITGYGQNSNLSHQAGHDLNFMAVSGMLNLFTNSNQSLQKTLPSYPFADFVGGGLMAAMKIVLALYERNLGKRKIYIDHGMVENLVELHPELLTRQKLPFEMLSGTLARYHVYSAIGGELFALAALEDKFWHVFCKKADVPHLSHIGFDAKKNKKAITELEKLFKQNTAQFWRNFCKKNDVCLTPVQNKTDLQKQGYLKPITIQCGTKKIKGAINKTETRKQAKYAKKCQDSVAILKKLGYSAKEIKTMQLEKIIGE
jgi:alpha-methylacyl-CoA racemase